MPTGALEAAESPALSLLSMSKSFGPTKALQNVDLLLRRGEVVALLGKENVGEMREQIEQATSLGVNGILIDHGPPEAVKDVIQEALDKGIKVVLKETSVDNPKVPQISQNDHEMARLVLEQALKDNGASFKAGYIYVPGFNPTDLRNDIWEKVKKANTGIDEQARWGAIDSTIAATVGNQTSASSLLRLTNMRAA